MALKYHPDKNKDAAAENKFKVKFFKFYFLAFVNIFIN